MRGAFRVLVVLLAVSVWMSCGSRAGEEVDRVALECCNSLIEGRYDDYVAAIAYSDSMTDEYRSQLVDLAAQFVAREKARRGGWSSVRVLGDTIEGDVASVFLEVTFGDSTREEISMPMVKCGDVWKMQ